MQLQKEKGQTLIYKTPLHRQLKSSNTNPTKNQGWTQVLRKGRSSWSTSGICHRTLEFSIAQIMKQQVKNIAFFVGMQWRKYSILYYTWKLFLYGNSLLFCQENQILFSMLTQGSSWWFSYCSWIYSYLCNQCLLLLKLWVRMPLMARCTPYNIMW